MKKKMLSLVLAGAMTAAVLTGCGSSASTTSDAATETAAETTEEAAGTEESADAEASAETSGGTFKIGGIGPLTGGAAVYGNAAMNGSQIAVDEINAFLLGNDMEIFLVVFDTKATQLGEKIFQETVEGGRNPAYVFGS